VVEPRLHQIPLAIDSCVSQRVVPSPGHGPLFVMFPQMLFLASTKRYFGFGDKDDHVVLDGGRVIGRIFMPPQAPERQPWFWTITAREHPTSIHSRGYSGTREQAMADFKAQWQS
jgi:hypothetical protein